MPNIVIPPRVIPLVRNPENPEAGVTRNDYTRLGSAFVSEETKTRRMAYRSLNDAAHDFGDALVAYSRQRHINLSSFAGNPSTTGQNTPGTIVFGDADRHVVDLSWVNLFRVQDNRGVPNDTFVIEDVYNAVEFREYIPGSPVDIEHIEYARNRFEYRTLAGGFQYEVYWQEDYPHWMVADGMIAMETKYALNLEEINITTIAASGALTTSYQTGTTEIEQDILTINEGQRQILNAIYTDTAPSGFATEERISRPVFFLMYNEFATAYTQRINRALAAGFAVPNDNIGGHQINHPVIPFPTPYVTGADWKLVLPGRKNMFVLKNDLRILMQFDPYAAGGVDSRIGHARIGSVRADGNQVSSLATA